MMIINNRMFKKITILMWAIWWSIAVWTDIVGGLSHLGFIHAAWAPDLNYPFLLKSLSMYALPVFVPPLLLVGIIVWALIAALAFWWSVMGFTRDDLVWFQRAEKAFILSLTLWFGFFISDQLILNFDLEQNHMVQGGFQLLSYLSLYWLPDR